ncbi:hypothetical protein CY34DRAFT_807860 [Suillus luteus UH-Slu-Lm8-n1]|uniref:Unplaced genomic scaffold CY34scaffold_197, whole genome shotgun sequence n=1 Tax=Suillus luteus UH-Slu-Lm8-n1 TaxID=930992 RepID=A0A0D0AP50_9AGAM|nr:hypothetical protein CY34DRAFT_807860 [Suillus luteus UH-Slu-Lm8-n1]
MMRHLKFTEPAPPLHHIKQATTRLRSGFHYHVGLGDPSRAKVTLQRVSKEPEDQPR